MRPLFVSYFLYAATGAFIVLAQTYAGTGPVSPSTGIHYPYF